MPDPQMNTADTGGSDGIGDLAPAGVHTHHAFLPDGQTGTGVLALGSHQRHGLGQRNMAVRHILSAA